MVNKNNVIAMVMISPRDVNWLLDVTLLPLLGGLRVRPSSPSMVNLSRKVSGGAGLEMTEGAGGVRREWRMAEAAALRCIGSGP
jgi:hypothetical protein